jgi:hypothetical protein
MKGLGYLEKVALKREEKCRWVVKIGGFSVEISVKEG